MRVSRAETPACPPPHGVAARFWSPGSADASVHHVLADRRQRSMDHTVQIHPLTLRFSDEALEQQLRGDQFKSSMKVSINVLLLNIPAHIFMSWLAPKYHIIAYIYLPIIILAIIGRYILTRFEDQSRGHFLNSLMWIIFLAIGNELQRGSIYMGWHPRIELVEATLYVREAIPSLSLSRARAAAAPDGAALRHRVARYTPPHPTPPHPVALSPDRPSLAPSSPPRYGPPLGRWAAMCSSSSHSPSSTSTSASSS